jgi:hypothetical protein
MMTIVYMRSAMVKKTFDCRQVALDHSAMVALRKAGKLNLGIDNTIAGNISSSGLKPTKTTAAAANAFWNLTGVLVFGISVYWSLTSAWWWFIPGIVAGFAIWRANWSANSENLLDAAMVDPTFYERVRSLNGWLYQIDEVEASRYATR